MNLSSNEISRLSGFVSADPVLIVLADSAKDSKTCHDVFQLAIDKVVASYGDPTGMWKTLPPFMRPTIRTMTAKQLVPHIAKFPKPMQHVITTVAGG